ncbi:MAG: S9 family peptidase, partial [Flavobacteriia bacterium]
MGKYVLSIVFLFLTSFGLFAQKGNISSLQIKDIMQGDDFVGHRPSNAHWSTDGKTLYFDWNPDGAMSDSLYAYYTASKKIQKVDFLTAAALPSSRITYNESKTKGIYSKNGDIFLMDLTTHTSTPITKTQDREGDPHFTHKGTKIAYTKGDDLYVWDMATGTTEQLTNFVSSKKSETKRDSKDEWLYQDQL